MKKQLALAAFAAAILALNSATAADYPGNGGTGFGGVIGLGSLNLTDNGTALTGTITKGPGGFNDALVIYLDTKAGGLSDTSTYTDVNGGNSDPSARDYLREAVSGFNGSQRATLTFPTGFAPDYAIALSPSSGAQFAGLFDLSTPSNFGFAGSANLTPDNSTSNATYTFSVPLSSLNLTSASSFSFVTTYLNPTSVYRSNESFGNVLLGTPADANLNFGQNPVTVANVDTYAGSAAAVPEPATVMLVGPAILAGIFFLRRRRTA